MVASIDAVVVGSGPNGLAAAITLARAGLAVQVREAQDTIGGGTRSMALTRPGFVHDVCSAIHPFALAAGFFRSLPLADFGLEWIQPPVPVAHPFLDGRVALLERSTAETGRWLGGDATAWRALMDPFVSRWEQLVPDALAPLHVPRHPLLLGYFGTQAFPPAALLARLWFRHEPARALFAGLAAHSTLPLTAMPSAAFGLMLGIAAHAVGWPLARGGSQRIANALAAYLQSLGGEILTGTPVESLDALPPARAVLLDLTPRQILRIAGDRFPARYRKQLQRYRYGPGVFKMDWALSAPIPWTNQECVRTATVHLGGTLADITHSERLPSRGRVSDTPYVLVAQPSLFDPSRAPAGKHTAWAYCHVPNGSARDMTAAIEGQIERYAPGFRDVILERSTMGSAALERHNANLVGGDIAAGSPELGQLFFRPALRADPYATPVEGLFICSASTPPGSGVHGMCGYHAAQSALKRVFGRGGSRR